MYGWEDQDNWKCGDYERYTTCGGTRDWDEDYSDFEISDFLDSFKTFQPSMRVALVEVVLLSTNQKISEVEQMPCIDLTFKDEFGSDCFFYKHFI